MTIERNMYSQIVDQLSIFRSIENIQSSRNRVCLFGRSKKSDDEYLNTMIQQQFEADRKRFIDRWGFDILYGGPAKASKDKRPCRTLEDDSRQKVSPRKKASPAKSTRNKENKCPDYASPKKSLKMTAEKSYVKNGRQSQMTDYWNYRKLSESSCSDKEN